MAYNIASLLNNLFGKGKEPFWQQAYTNLVKFIIQLHKVAYDYVTLFDVYECAINPELLDKRIHEAESLIEGRHYFVVSNEDFLVHPELERFGFVGGDPVGIQKAPQSRALEEALKTAQIDYDAQTEAFDLLQLLNTGHSGTLSTVHANSAYQALSRFTTCVLQSEMDLPYRAIKSNIADSLNLLVQIERRPGRRFVSEVLEIAGYNPESDRYQLDPIFNRQEEPEYATQL